MVNISLWSFPFETMEDNWYSDWGGYILLGNIIHWDVWAEVFDSNTLVFVHDEIR